MADAAQRQRKLAAKVARRKMVLAEKKALETSSNSVAGRVRVAARGRIARCVMSSSLFEMGMGSVMVARTLPSGLLGCAYFLLDTFCLGVKDVFYAECGQTELRSRLAEQGEFTDIEPAYARKLIRDAAAYAAVLGLSAEKDTPVIEAIFGDVDEADCTETFTFGKDGEPFFLSGPNDTPARIRAVMLALEKSRGLDGCDYLGRGAGGPGGPSLQGLT